MADLYIPGEVYTNLRKMIVRRGGVPSDPELNNKQIAQLLSQREYIIISAERPQEDLRGAATIGVVLIAPGSKVVRASATLKKLMRDVMKLKKAVPLEVLIITDEPMQERLMVHDEIKDKHTGVSIENYPYMIFLVDITAHESSPEHYLVSEDEISAFCKRYRVQKSDFSKILSSDPQAVWLGLRPGMIVRIIRPSESAGYAPTYRVCVK